ncbi:unnamed protein product [Laminaria digitata]
MAQQGYSYVKRVSAAVSREDAVELEACLSMDPRAIPGGQRLMESGLSDADIDAVSSGGGRHSFPPVILSISKEMILYLQSLKNHDAKNAFRHYRGAYRVFVEDNALLGFRGGQSGWLLPTLVSMSRGVRILADETGGHDEKAQADVTGLLHTAFSACLRDRSTDPAESKKQMAMHMAVVLYKHCFKINSLKTCQDLSKVVRGGTGDAEALACRADVVGFLYFEGLLLMRSAANDKLQRAKAERTLTRALKECHYAATGNRRRILANLVPLRMRMGCLPDRELLEKHNLLIFDDFCTAISQGDLRRFSVLMKRHERTLELTDLRPHLEGCRLIAYRQVLRKIARATGTHTIPLSVVKLGFVLNGHDFDGDSLEDHGGQDQTSRESLEQQEAYRYDQLKATLATLIVQGVISGVIRSRDNKLQLSKKNPFPPLPGRSDLGRRRSPPRNAFGVGRA